MKETVDIDVHSYRLYIKFRCKDCDKELVLVDELAIECPECGKRYILDVYESAYQSNK